MKPRIDVIRERSKADHMRELTGQTTTVIDALRLNDRELAAIMARDAQRVADNATSAKRPGMVRDDLPRMIVRICHQRGNCTTYLVKPRDIHEHGMIFLHGSFVHEGAACFAILRDGAGRPTQIPATAFRCRHISGRVHELVAVFDRPIHRANYLYTDGTPVSAVSAENPLPATESPHADSP